VEETGIPGGNHRPAAGDWQTISHNVVSSEIRTHTGGDRHWLQTANFKVLAPIIVVYICLIMLISLYFSLFCIHTAQALVSFNKYMPPPLPYFKVNIYPFPLSHFASIFFAYLWSFHWPNYIVTLQRYFSFRLPHSNIPTGPPSDELDKNIQRMSLSILFSHWNGYSHFRSDLNWFRK
jgi:hypothetical protein